MGGRGAAGGPCAPQTSLPRGEAWVRSDAESGSPFFNPQQVRVSLQWREGLAWAGLLFWCF